MNKLGQKKRFISLCFAYNLSTQLQMFYILLNFIVISFKCNLQQFTSVSVICTDSFLKSDIHYFIIIIFKL